MEIILNCALCGSQKSSLLSSSENKWKLVRCRECDLVYLNPRSSISEINKFYPKDYERHWVLEHYLNKQDKWSKRLYRGIADAYSSCRTNFWKKRGTRW